MKIKNMHQDVYSNFNHNSPKLEKTVCPAIVTVINKLWHILTIA